MLMSRCLYSNVSKVPYHILLLVHVSEAAKVAALSHTSCLQEVPTTLEAAKMAALSYTSCLQEVPTTLQLEAILNIQVAFVKVQVTPQHYFPSKSMVHPYSKSAKYSGLVLDH